MIKSRWHRGSPARLWIRDQSWDIFPISSGRIHSVGEVLILFTIWMIQRAAAWLPGYWCQVLVNPAIHDVLRRAEVWEEDSFCSVRGRRPLITHLREEALLVWGPQNLHWGRVSQHQHSPPLCTQISTKQCQDTHLYKNPLVKPVVSVVINSVSLVKNQPGAKFF